MEDSECSVAKTQRVENTIPILCVVDMAQSLEYYSKALGFRKDWGTGISGQRAMCSVSRDGHAIMLCQEDQGQPRSWVWIGVEDVDLLYEELTASGAVIIQRPMNHPWALKVRVPAPVRNVLRFWSEPKSDRPFVTPG